jgi:hypothetical protein
MDGSPSKVQYVRDVTSAKAWGHVHQRNTQHMGRVERPLHHGEHACEHGGERGGEHDSPGYGPCRRRPTLEASESLRDYHEFFQFFKNL